MHGDCQDGEPFQCMQGFEPTVLKNWQWKDHLDGSMSLMGVMNGNMSVGACTQGKLLMLGMKNGDMCGGANREQRMKPGSIERLNLSSVGWKIWSWVG